MRRTLGQALRRLRAARPVLALSLLVAAGAPAAGPPGCPADFTMDGQLSVFDILAFFDRFAGNSIEADTNGDLRVDVQDILRFFEWYGAGCDFTTDTDGDGLADIVETGTGVFAGPSDTGTSALLVDTDNDGLDDGDEVLGTTDGLDLRSLGVSPVRRDILVEVDWFEGTFEGVNRSFRPSTSMVSRIVAAFAAAPLVNPDGTTGINCIVDYGQGGVFTGGNRLPGAPLFITLGSDFLGYKADHFSPQRRRRFHYCIFAYRQGSETNRSSGVAEINGDDFVVSLVDYYSSYNGATTFLHEIGHNLGLRHGGFENRNYKPNYRSVMNYRYQFPGRDVTGDARGDGLIDYSDGSTPVLDETALLEPIGLGLGPAIDWNGNGVLDALPVSRNINCRQGLSVPCGSTADDCDGSLCGQLFDFDDWGSINWNRLRQSSDGEPRKTAQDPDPAAREIVECHNWPGR